MRYCVVKKVIVVDDFVDSAKTLSDMFEEQGIKVVGIGHNGKDAFDLYKTLQPDFLVLDMKMPKYDGKYAVKKIKSEFPDAKIITITGYDEYEFAENEVLASFSKPFDINEVTSLIQDKS